MLRMMFTYLQLCRGAVHGAATAVLALLIMDVVDLSRPRLIAAEIQEHILNVVHPGAIAVAGGVHSG